MEKGDQIKWSFGESSGDNLDMSSEEKDFGPEADNTSELFHNISTDVQQKLLKKFADCKNCGGQLEIVEMTSASISVGKVWQFSCTTMACDTNKSDDTAMSQKNGQYFEINRMLVFAMHLTGNGHPTTENTTFDEFAASCTPHLLEKTYQSFD